MSGINELHPDTRIIVSALPDEKDPVTGNWIYLYHCDTRLKEANIPREEVLSFNSESRTVVQALLNSKGRILLDDYWLLRI